MKCPSTMCPVMAPNGSFWTGEKDADCINVKCVWWHKGHCQGGSAALEQVREVEEKGSTLQINPVGQKFAKRKATIYDCARANDCQWQKEAGEGLCPPREALSKGLDARVCLF